MTKAEKIGILIAAASFVVTVAAWRFPVEPKASVQRNLVEAFLEQSKSKVRVQSEPKFSLETNFKEDSKTDATPLITSLSFSSFFVQMKSFPFDQDRLDFARSSKRLLNEKLKFNQLETLVSEIKLDSNKLEMITILLDKVDRPTENEIEDFLKQFSLPSNRKEALDLIYQ